VRLFPVLLVLPLAAAVLSGCAGSKAPAAPRTEGITGATPAVWAAIQDKMTGVPCDATVGSDTSPNLVQLSNISYAEEAGMHGELDIRGHLAVHARYAAGGFEMVDISDPLNPRYLGDYDYNGENATGNALDVKFTPDNATVLVGLNTGIIMADVRDPANAHTVGEWNFTDAKVATDPAPRVSENAHMFYTHRIDGVDWVFLAPNSNTGIWMLKIEGTPDHRTLQYVAQTLPVEGGPLGPHDLYVQQDATDHHWYLYSADGFHGWTVFNVDDPAHPQMVGGLVNPAEGAYTHSIQAQWINGRRLVATIGEVGANILKVYDATNFRAPLLLGVYAVTSGLGPGSPEHNFNIVAGKLYLSYYSHGMYVFDLTKLTGTPAAGTLNMQPVAHYSLGSSEPGVAVPPNVPLFTGIWDTVLQDGLIYLSNIHGGLIVVGYGCNHAPDPTLTSTG